MQKVHPDIAHYYEGGITKSWQNDPWSRERIQNFFLAKSLPGYRKSLVLKGVFILQESIRLYTQAVWRVLLNQVHVPQKKLMHYNRDPHCLIIEKHVE